MVRFIIKIITIKIRNRIIIYIPIWLDLLFKQGGREKNANNKIYIPIWLDLLFSKILQAKISFHYLHSNMVRFIMSADL